MTVLCHLSLYMDRMAVSRLFGYMLYIFTPLSNAKDCFVSCYICLLHYLNAKDCFVLSFATDVYYIISMHT